MKKTTTETLEERQARIADARREAQAILDALDLAESCETPEDFDANLRDALTECANARREINEIGNE